jgi:peroxiredoxin
LPDQTGQARTFEDLTKPRGLVLFVYLKDFTSGCATETQEFQDLCTLNFDDMGYYHLTRLSKDPVPAPTLRAQAGLRLPPALRSGSRPYPLSLKGLRKKENIR